MPESFFFVDGHRYIDTSKLISKSALLAPAEVKIVAVKMHVSCIMSW